jgi:ribonuclease T1
MSISRRSLKLRSLAALAVAGTLAPACAASAARVSAGTVCHSSLPPQADDTLTLIAQGGPFPYRQDGQVFQNREGVLPSEPTGYYHEYTVKTPGAPTRGARRIVTAQSGTDYYTADHYVTFDAIDFGC